MKIVRVINSIINNRSLISDIKQNELGYNFIFNKKFMFSIEQLYSEFENETYYSLSFFPEKDDLSLKATYDTLSINTREAKASFEELFQLLSEKRLGIDKAFDEIMEMDIPF